MSWMQFAMAAPFLAQLGRERFELTEVVLLGTLGKDGSPRISPVEFVFVDDELMVGMMWQSKKALDLLRDPRFVVHNTVANKDGAGGDFKLYGRAVVATDEGLLGRMWRQVLEATGWNPTGPSHVFTLNIQSCGFTVYGAKAGEFIAGAKAAGMMPRLLGEDVGKPDGMAISWSAR